MLCLFCSLLLAGVGAHEPRPTDIAKVETITLPNATAKDLRQLVFVRVTLEDGTDGLGQCGGHKADLRDGVLEVMHNAFSDSIVGMDAQDIHKIERHAWEQTEYYKSSGESFYRALSGLDSAIWDALGKRANMSVCNLWRKQRWNLTEPCPERFPVYGSSLTRSKSPKDLAAKVSAAQHKYGVSAFKVKIANRMGHNVDVYENRSEEVVAACRSAIGDDAALMVDANSGYDDPEHALAAAAMLRRYNVSWFEEPCQFDNLACAREVRSQGGLPVALGEQEYRLFEDWRLMLGMHADMAATDIAQPDLGYIGGPSRALQVAEWARAKSLRFTPHNPGNTMKVYFTLHLMASLPPDLAMPWMEFSCIDNGLEKSLVAPEFDLVGGTLKLPSGPGWGVSLDLTGANVQTVRQRQPEHFEI